MEMLFVRGDGVILVCISPVDVYAFLTFSGITSFTNVIPVREPWSSELSVSVRLPAPGCNLSTGLRMNLGALPHIELGSLVSPKSRLQRINNPSTSPVQNPMTDG